jgi:glycosyltransferase involved in cell wall biosynthesis
VRVLVVSPWEPWRTGDGVVLALHHHLHELAGRHRFTVLAAGSSDDAEQQLSGSAATLPEGVDVRWFGTARPAALDYAERRLRSEWRRDPAHTLFVERPGLLAALPAAAADADLVHLVGWGTAQLAAAVAPTPAVHFAVDPWAANFANRSLPPWRRLSDIGQVAKARRHERRYYPSARAVVVVSEDDAGQLRKDIPGARIVVVPNGVIAGPPPVPLPVEPVLGFHGAFEARHNVDAARALVEQILPGVRAIVPAAKALVVGRDPTPAVQRLAGDAVEVRGSVPDIRVELDRLGVYVAWMTSGFGLKNKVLEAMAAGRPVVASDRGASGIGAGPGLVVARNEADAVEQVVRLLRDPAAAAAAGADNRRRVERDFTWAASAARMEAVWEQAVGE